MQLNYYFLKRLVPELDLKLQSAVLVECFSQDKDELIMAFSLKNSEDFYIRATLTSTFSCLSFPSDFKRSRKNSVSLFQSLIGQTIKSVKQFLNERAFSVIFEEHELLFKMHGNRSNLVLFDKNEATALFKKQLQADWKIDISKLDRPIERSLPLYLENPNHKDFYPTFGKVPSQYLKHADFDKLTEEEQWQLLQKTEITLNSGPAYLAFTNHKPIFSLLPYNTTEELPDTALTASNAFFRAYTGTWYFEQEKQQILSEIKKRISQTENYIYKSEALLKKLVDDIQPEQVADILMANMHQIPPRQKKVKLFNFYSDKDIEIKLNPDLSPQKNAEQYYRKSKNRKIEVEKTENNVFSKYEGLERLKSIETQLEEFTDTKALRRFLKAEGLDKAATQESQIVLPYKPFEVEGYQIWVGKNARSNDELTLKHAYKEDLWLHAKDVPGSHVLIKDKAGRKTPKEVIERGAELAAYYSKRKTDSLVPVIVTPAKFVRKRKGSPAGQVIVSKEEVIMVPPRGPINS